MVEGISGRPILSGDDAIFLDSLMDAVERKEMRMDKVSSYLDDLQGRGYDVSDYVRRIEEIR